MTEISTHDASPQPATALLLEARGRDRPRLLRRLPARPPARAERRRTERADGNAERDRRARAAARHPRRAAAAAARPAPPRPRPGAEPRLRDAERRPDRGLADACSSIAATPRSTATGARRCSQASAPSRCSCSSPLRRPASSTTSSTRSPRSAASISTRASISQLYHPLAAMPSIHVTIAVVTADGLRRTSRSGLVRAVAPAYPPLVAAVVLLTANHYVVDAAAGSVLGRLTVRLSRRLLRLALRRAVARRRGRPPSSP